MSTRFYPRQTDYIPALNAMDDDVQLAISKGDGAAQAKIDAETARDLAQKWATQLSTPVAAGEYSAKYHAQAAAGSVTTAQGHATTAQNWATSLSVVSGGLYGARYYANDASASATSAKNWATQASGEVVTGQGYSAKYYATSSASNVTLSQNWATQLTTEVVAGQGYSARQYAVNASGSATLAQNWATQLGTAVAGGEYSAKYHAQAAAASASSMTGSVSAAQTAATSAQNWATQNSGEVVTGQGYSAKYHAVAAAGSASSANTSATLAQDWATKASGEVVTGQGYSARYWAQQAATSAGQASAGQINSDWNQTNPAEKSFIQNKPTIPVLSKDNIESALNYTPWHAGNDGAASGLDADLLDGAQSDTEVNGDTIARRTNMGELKATWFIMSAAANAQTAHTNFASFDVNGVMYRNTKVGFLTSLGLNNVQNKSSATILGELTGTSILGKIGTVPVANGGTGATTAAAALTNLGAEPALPAGGTSIQYLAGNKTWVDFQDSVRGAALTGYSVGTNMAIAAGDTVIGAFQKIQAQINNKLGTDQANAQYGYAILSNYDMVLPKTTTGGTPSYLRQNNSTAGRVYTFPDKSGTVAMTDDLAGGTTPITAAATLGAGDYVYTGNYLVTLNDLTTMNGKRPTFLCPANLVTPPGTIKTSDNWLVYTGFSSGSTKTIMPLRTDTPHGWWGNLSMIPNTLATVTNQGGNMILQSSIQLSATCIIIALIPSGNNNANVTHYFYAINPQTGAIVYLGGVTAYTGGSDNNIYSNPNSLFATSATSFAYTYNTSTTYISEYDPETGDPIYSTRTDAMVAGWTLNASNGSNGFTTNTVVTNEFWTCTPAQLTDNITFVGMTSASTNNIRSFKINGTTFTNGTAFATWGIYSNNRWAKMLGISATQAVIVGPWHQNQSSNTYIQIATVSGNSVSLGTYHNPSGMWSYGINYGQVGTALVPMGGGRFAYMANAANESRGCTFSISGSTITSQAGVGISSLSFQNGVYNTKQFLRTRMTPNWAQDKWTAIISTDYLTYMEYPTSQSATRKMGTFYLPSNAAATSAGTTSYSTAVGIVQAFTGGAYYTLHDPSNTGSASRGFSKFQGPNGLAAQVATTNLTTSIFSDTLTDAAVSYGGTWYTYPVPEAWLPIAADKYINVNSSNITVYGNFS